MSAKATPKEFAVTSATSSPSSTSSSSNMRTLSPLSTYLVLYLFFSAQVFPRGSSAAQKFYPNGRYGRRSDLPPLMGTQLINKMPIMSSNNVDALLSQVDLSKESPPQAYAVEEYAPMWCAEVDRKTNLFKCFDRLPFKLSMKSSDLTRAQQQEQQEQA